MSENKTFRNLNMTASEYNTTIQLLSKVYDVVRAVDVNRQREIFWDDYGVKHINEAHCCFETWDKNERCRNCVSSQALFGKSRKAKFEFIGNQIFHVTSQYVTVDGEPYVLELVQNVSDTVLEGAFGKSTLKSKILGYEEQLYTDSLTKVRNRMYFDEQIQDLEMDAVAVLDIDFFKEVNDTYGHICGDEVLRLTASSLRRMVRSEDSVVRLGGDEFLIAFPSIPEHIFIKRLHTILQAVENLRIENYPDLRITLSIGGVYHKGKTNELFSLADKALYEAKKTRNTVKISKSPS